ncbi:probable rRNA-processing protein EBP2 [Mizuhopecten yessoensis]|uniref:probable rRNA-processing protein EBP2 n=1 Tax=Mizuhopecten yessoensis TaxID=6573 RepID=UPI000B45C986|nr:probable rRNA-processing protein EBP2 [Mizuhopecten yessoensis]
MSESDYSSEQESADSDTELQLAFAEGRLSDGLNVQLVAPKTFTNHVEGLKAKLAELKNGLGWLERLDLTNEPAPAQPGTDMVGDEDIHDDFKRELTFYRQAQATVLQGIQQLQKLGVKTKRPEDYFAQMAKSDDHMKMVRQKLLEKQVSMEMSEKAKKMRELRKYGKKVQHEVLQKRQKEKREMMDAVKKYRKGQKDKLDFLDDKGPPNKKQKTGQKQEFHVNKKREFKNQKFGFGGQKKRSKMNTAKSSADMSDFNPSVHQTKHSYKSGGKKSNAKKKGPAKRPGKSKRQNMKSRKR